MAGLAGQWQSVDARFRIDALGEVSRVEDDLSGAFAALGLKREPVTDYGPQAVVDRADHSISGSSPCW